MRTAIVTFLALMCACSKKKDAGLSLRGLDPEDNQFIFILADRVAEELKIDDTPEAVERVRRLPEHWRYLEPLVYYYNEVNNGGHHQYFWNSHGVYRELVREGLTYYGAPEFEQIFADASARYKPEDYEPEKGATWEAFQAAYKDQRYEAQDSRFYALKPDLAEIVTSAVRRNLHKFKAAEPDDPDQRRDRAEP